MGKIGMKWMICALLLHAGIMSNVHGQLASTDFIYGGVEDAEKILQAYLEPFANVLGSDLNAGWYNTARPHELGGLDLTFTVSMSRAPSSMLTYDALTLGLNGEVISDNGSLAPTVTGDMDERPSISYSQTVEGIPGSIEYARFELPNGSGVDYFPLPMAQLSVGLPLGTDVSVRFVPMIQLAKYGQIGLWGVGGKHSLSQWIPVLKELEFLEISAQGGYTAVNASVNVDVEPLEEVGGIPVYDPTPDYNWHDQFVDQAVRGWTTNLIASQTFSVLTVYEGIGYASSEVEMAMRGHYPVHTIVDETGGELDPGTITYEIAQDPISMKFRNINNVRWNIGLRLKLAFLTLHYDFTYTLYATHSAGIGVTFR